ncbi:MAG TPA: GGDEF domain-containing protein [Chromatiales bacterium]|nr:GGDEF domain-containing protein [Chromatiales bacterium]
MAKRITELKDLWSATEFEHADLSAYAEAHILEDTRKGVTTLGIVSMMLLASGALVYATIGSDTVYVYTCGLLALFSVHMALSSNVVKQSRVLHLLGMTLLVVIGTAFVLLAHRLGAFNTDLYISVVLLFMVMPLVPWGLREAVVAITLVYAVFTMSTLSVQGRFDAYTLWMLQFLMLAGAMVTLTVVARGVDVRKQDIRLRFELERARKEMELLSNKDPLTETWNRRYLDSHCSMLLDQLKQQSAGGIYFGLLDVDRFKQINDTLGHGVGDEVLRELVRSIKKVVGNNGYLFRIGGDEFALLVRDPEPVSLVRRAVDMVNASPGLRAMRGDNEVNVSCGFLPIEQCGSDALERIYSEVDKLLYCEKSAKQRKAPMKEDLVDTAYYGLGSR